jgi:GNAT superfamily N-acetyltransferase
MVPAMEFRWDWLWPLLRAPYVPTLGPVHPKTLGPELFADVIQIAGTGRFLPHDKDRRWAESKSEQVLVEAVVQQPGLVLIPTLATSAHGASVKVHIYSGHPAGIQEQAAQLCRELCVGHGASRGRLVWFSPRGSRPDPVAACTRIQLRAFGPGHLASAPEPGVVTLLEEAAEPVRDTFSAFAEKLATEGFAFLYAQICQRGTGPVLACVQDGRVVGAIGPMEIMPDSLGAARLLPQYFGVLPEYRGRGYGRALWRAAMHWGHQHGAAYQLLQTEAGGASDRLCRTEGLTDLGLVCTSTL